MTPSPSLLPDCVETPSEGDCSVETHIRRWFSASCGHVFVTLCTRVSRVMDDLWTEWGSYQEWLSSVTLASLRHRPVECFSDVGETLQFRLLISGNDRTSLDPPLHTHTLSLPHSSVIHEWKRSLVFTVTAGLLLHYEQTQGCGEEADRRTSSLVSSAEPKEREQAGFGFGWCDKIISSVKRKLNVPYRKKRKQVTTSVKKYFFRVLQNLIGLIKVGCFVHQLQKDLI